MTGGAVASPWLFALATPEPWQEPCPGSTALAGALPRDARLGGVKRVGGGVDCRRGAVELLATGFEAELERPDVSWFILGRSAGFEAGLAEQGVEAWAGMKPGERVRRKFCTARVAEARRDFVEAAGSAVAPVELGVAMLILLVVEAAGSAVAPVELGVGMLFLLIGDAVLLLDGDEIRCDAIGGADMVLPGGTRCFNIGISDASPGEGLAHLITVDIRGSATAFAVDALVGCGLLSSSANSSARLCARAWGSCSFCLNLSAVIFSRAMSVSCALEHGGGVEDL